MSSIISSSGVIADMYDILYELVNHVWSTEYPSSSEQAYIYQASLALIVLILVIIIDRFFSIIFSFMRGRGVR